MNQFWSGNECEILTHSQQQSQAPNAHKKESTVRLTTRITMLWDPQRSLLYRLKDSIEVKCKTHTQQSTSSSESLRPANLTENAQRHFQAVWSHGVFHLHKGEMLQYVLMH